MLRGNRVNLRLTRQSDLAQMHDLSSEIANRGDYYPLSLKSESTFRADYEKTGFWGEDHGLLLICDATDDRIVGNVAFFKTVPYYIGFEIGYRIYDPKDHGKGFASEATWMFCKYLFNSKSILRLTIQVESENVSSRRVAEKAGFKLEGVARSVFENRGKPTDIEVWSLTHADFFSTPSI